MKIRYDRERCTGHGRCYALAPDVFGEDDEGYCVPETTEPGPDQQAKARLAVDNCPEEALSIEE